MHIFEAIVTFRTFYPNHSNLIFTHMNKGTPKRQLIRSQKGFKKYIANTSWLLGGKIFNIAITLFVGVYVARYLGPRRFGLLNYAISYTGLFVAFSKLGLDNIVIRELVNKTHRNDCLLGTAFILKLIGAIITCYLIFISVRLTSSDPTTKLLIYIIMPCHVFYSFQVIDFYFQSSVRSKYSVIVGFFVTVIMSSVKLVLVLMSKTLLYFAFILVVEQMILSIGLLFIYSRQNLSVLKWNYRFNVAKDLLAKAWPLILSTIAVSIYMKIDQIMIKEMIDAESVGIYAVAVKLSVIWYFLPILIAQSLFPAIISAQKANKSHYYSRLQSFFDMMTWLGIAIALPISLAASGLVNLLFGEQYINAGLVLSVYAWTGVFVFLGVANGKWLIAENMQKITFYRTLLGSIINIILNYLLIPRQGIIGAAIATLSTQAIVNFFFLALFDKTRLTFWMQLNAFVAPIRLIFLRG